MARDWTDLFITSGGASGVATTTAEEEPARRRGFFSRLRENLSKTRSALSAEVQATLLSGDVDEETWERLEEALIMADVGASTTARVVGQLEEEAGDGGLEGGEALSGRLVELLADIARPREAGSDRIDLRREPTVIMAVDVSLSMKATDIDPTRFQAMQTAAKQFVDVLPARINLGLVSFAGTATTLVPPTTDRAQVRTAIDHLQLAEATAIGEAVFTSLSAIENYQDSLDTPSRDLPPARIVLLSDGYNTVGRDDTQAIDAATSAKVPVSTIAFGTDYGTLDLNGETVPVPVDRATLKKIADETGGSYSQAASAGELEKVYADLGSQIGYTTEPHDISPWFVRAGVFLAFLGAVLSLLWTQRLL